MARWAIWARWAAETEPKKHPGLYWRWNMSMRSIPNLNKNPVATTATTKKFTHYWLKSLFLRMTKEQPLKTNKNMRSCKDTLQSSILFAVEKISTKVTRSNHEICGSVMGNLLAALVWFSACAWLRSSKLRWPWRRTKHPWHRPTLCQFFVCFGLI